MLNFGIGFLFGLVFGSLIKCLADRSLANKSFFGRSYCPHCKVTLGWYDLLPVVSYILTRGKCRYCHHHIPFEYPATELTTAVIFGYLFFSQIPADLFQLTTPQLIIFAANLILKIVIISTVLVALITDLKEGLIPDRITYPAVILSLGLMCFIFIVHTTALYQSLSQSDLGKYLLPPYSGYFYNQLLTIVSPLFIGISSALGIGLFFAILIIVTRGRGMGGGDLKLGIFMGLVLGFPGSLVALMLAFLTGSIAGIGLLIAGKKRFGQTIPFGPFLSLGTVIAIFWGDQIANWYLHYHL